MINTCANKEIRPIETAELLCMKIPCHECDTRDFFAYCSTHERLRIYDACEIYMTICKFYDYAIFVI